VEAVSEVAAGLVLCENSDTRGRLPRMERKEYPDFGSRQDIDTKINILDRRMIVMKRCFKDAFFSFVVSRHDDDEDDEDDVFLFSTMSPVCMRTCARRRGRGVLSPV
jgi:hypothetical protein